MPDIDAETQAFVEIQWQAALAANKKEMEEVLLEEKTTPVKAKRPKGIRPPGQKSKAKK